MADSFSDRAISYTFADTNIHDECPEFTILSELVYRYGSGVAGIEHLDAE
jgi:hypothetical protein